MSKEEKAKNSILYHAKCIEKYFHINFYDALNDNELLPDDKYFKTYNESKDIYDKVLESIGDIYQYDSIDKTVKYFKQEYLIDE